MNTTRDYLNRIPAAQVRNVIQQLVCSEMTGKPIDNPSLALQDLESMPQETRSLETLVMALSTDRTNRAGSAPWFKRTAALVDVLTLGLHTVTRTYPEPAHRSFLRLLPARSYMEQQFISGLDGLIAIDQVNEHGELKDFALLETAVELEKTTAKRRGAILSISEPLIVNDDSGPRFFADTAKALMAAAWRDEAKQVFSVLNANPNLNDGAAWINSGNSVTASTVAGVIAAGVANITGQTFSTGELCGHPPAFLVCPPSWTVSDAVLLTNLPTIKVISHPLAGSTGWLLTDPAQQAALGLAAFGNGMPVVEMNDKLPARRGLQMSIQHSFSILPLSRAGICRLTVA